MSVPRLRVVHIITDLDVGGAELVLSRLLAGMDPLSFEQTVISLKSPGPVSAEIKNLGIPVTSPGMQPGLMSIAAFPQLIRLLRKSKPDLVQTWMYHADLIGGLAARLASRRIPVIWGIRNNLLVPGASRPRTARVVRMLASLSGWLPARIVSCAEAAKQVHISLGYSPQKFTVIANGFDLQRFRPDAAAHTEVRSELGLPPETTLVGLAARFDPVKDHQNFVAAAGFLLQQHPDVHFLLCGEGIIWDNADLAGWISLTGKDSHFHLLGMRPDVPRLMAALDVAVSASFSEAFPNTIAEAMACGVPVAATDAGDSALILGDTANPVPVRDSKALADACAGLLAMDAKTRETLSRTLRERIETHFNLDSMVRNYEALYRRTASFSPSQRRSAL